MMQTKHLYFLTTNAEYSRRNGKKLSAWWRCWEWLIDFFSAAGVYVQSFAILKVVRCTEICKDYLPAESVAHISESGRTNEDCIRRWLHNPTNTESRNTAGLSGIRVICSSFRITSPSSIVSVSEIIPCPEQYYLKHIHGVANSSRPFPDLTGEYWGHFWERETRNGKRTETKRAKQKGHGEKAQDFLWTISILT